MQIDLKYDVYLEKRLGEHRFFQRRTGMSRKKEAPKTRFKIGDVLLADTRAEIEAYATIFAGNRLFTVGAFSSVGSDLGFLTAVGRYCSIAEGVKVLGYRHPIEAVSQSSAVFNFEREFLSAYRTDRRQLGKFINTPAPVKTPQPEQKISIGHDVWIGANVMLSPGIKIGNGAIVAANSLVLKDVPAYTIVGGSPAKTIRPRFDTEVIKGLEASRWWEYELSDMFDFELNFNDPLLFLKQFTELEGQLSLASYAKTSGLMLFMKDNIHVYETAHGTVLRINDNTICHDADFLNKTGLTVKPADIHHDLKVERNGDATISWKRGSLYLSAAADGTTLWVKKNGRQERFFHHAYQNS